MQPKAALACYIAAIYKHPNGQCAYTLSIGVSSILLYCVSNIINYVNMEVNSMFTLAAESGIVYIVSQFKNPKGFLN
jgi:hypothetical protein